MPLLETIRQAFRPRPASSPEGVLVLEDTSQHRAILTRIVRAEGYPVLEAETVAEAMEIVRTRGPWLYVLDYELPDGTCYDLLRYADRKLKHPAAAILATTYRVDDESVVPARWARRFCGRVCKLQDFSEYAYHLRRAIRSCRTKWQLAQF